MHGEIDPAVDQRLFDFLDEQTLSTDFGQGDLQNGVPLRFEDGNLCGNRWVERFDGGLCPVRLPERELAPARSYFYSLFNFYALF